MSFSFYARGHPAVTSTHRTTLEFTKEATLTEKGNCIIAVESSATLRDLPQQMRDALSKESARARLTLKLRAYEFEIEGRGAPGLSFSHPTDMVVRTSSFVSNRTLMVRASGAAINIPRPFVKLLQDPDQKLLVEISLLH